MVPNDAIIKLVMDRNSELEDRILELKDLYNRKHDSYLRREKFDEDPIFGTRERTWFNVGLDHVIKAIRGITKQLIKVSHYESIMDAEFRKVLMWIADKYSIILNEYMKIKGSILNSYAEESVDRLVSTKNSTSDYLDKLENYLDVVKMAVKNEVNAYRVQMESI
jgi:hypothetical protein